MFECTVARYHPPRMRRLILTLALLLTAVPPLWLIYAWFTSTDANLQLAHSAAHLHADQQSVELIYTHLASDPPPEDYLHDLAVVTVKRSSYAFGWDTRTAYTSYVVTSPQLALMPLTAVMPAILILRLRREMYRRLDEPLPPATPTTPDTPATRPESTRPI